jgi:hypothetical protein
VIAIATWSHADVEALGAWIVGTSTKVVREADGSAILVAMMHTKQFAWHRWRHLSFALAFAAGLVGGG